MQDNHKNNMNVVVVLSNEKDKHRAADTLQKVREIGQWTGDLVWMAIAFSPDPSFVEKWSITVLKRPMLEVHWLWDLRQKHPFTDTDDREKSKLIQFSKWRVFDCEFRKWRSMLYLDAGMHIANPIAPLFSVPHTDRFVAPDDRFPFNDPHKTFRIQWDAKSMPDVYRDLESYCDWLDHGGYFLNCMWLMDTSLILPDTQDLLLALLRRFPISRTNEMALMNLYFHDTWQPLPEKDKEDRRLFDWTERFGRATKDYILLKYPHFPVTM
jgi:hypothetical protein